MNLTLKKPFRSFKVKLFNNIGNCRIGRMRNAFTKPRNTTEGFPVLGIRIKFCDITAVALELMQRGGNQVYRTNKTRTIKANNNRDSACEA